MDFLSTTTPHREVIDQALDHYTASLKESSPPILIEAMRYSLLLPGKRIRPLLVLMACEACGGNMQDALPAACAVEMVHAFSVIHDDLPAMDDDDLRRGEPTNHRVFGEAQAILAGDSLFAFAFELLATEIQDPTIAAKCCSILALASGPSGMAGGQSDDIQGLSEDATEEDLASLHRSKTGALIESCVHMGALIGGGSEEQITALQEYAWRIGLAFQIMDDVLDTTATAEELGKTPGKDEEQGKITYVSLLGKAESEARAEELIAEAKQQLEVFEDNEMLETLADFVLERKN